MNAREADLDARLERLERKNRLLSGLCLLSLSVPLMALAGWDSATQKTPVYDLVRAKRFEVVDDRGVPLVTVGKDRSDGGAVVLRDAGGERRAWWMVDRDHAAFTMTSDGTGDRPSSTLGMSVSSGNSQISLISPKGSQFSASIEGDQPRVDLWGTQGQTLFGAPWKAGTAGGGE
jgi:hypothetical protein